jgi:hypothetical protein
MISEICSNKNVNVALERTASGVLVTVSLPYFPLGTEKEKGDENVAGKRDNYIMETNPSHGEMTAQPVKREKDLELIQLKEINAELMRQVEKLQSQKEKLEQQVAVLSEGTAYI